MDTEEIIAALAAGIIAGIILALIEQNFPTTGIGRV